MIFQVLIEVTPSEVIYPILNSGFFGTVHYLASDNYRIKLNALNILQKIAYHQTGVFLQDFNFVKAMPELFKILENQKDDDKTISLKVGVC